MRVNPSNDSGQVIDTMAFGSYFRVSIFEEVSLYKLRRPCRPYAIVGPCVLLLAINLLFINGALTAFSLWRLEADWQFLGGALVFICLDVLLSAATIIRIRSILQGLG